jgi:hypothetical protein
MKNNKYNVVEFVGGEDDGSIQVKPFSKPAGDVIKTITRDGLVKKCFNHAEGREWIVESVQPIDFDGEGSWSWGEGFNN